MKTLEFSYNWNRKLDCKSFSTVRIENPSKYILLDEYLVILKTKGKGPDIDKGIARLQSISHFFLDKVSPAISYLDANLNVFEFQKLVLRMYKNHNINFQAQRLSFLVFQYIPISQPEKQEAQKLEMEM